MKMIFTICSNNYLAQAAVLGASVKEHQPDARFIICLCDEMLADIDYRSLADEVLPAADIEPQMQALALRYNIVELNTCIKPRVLEYLLEERNAAKVLYLDPDIQLYQPLTNVFDVLDNAHVALTPHIYTPIPLDGKKPAEHTFLNYGIYNLGFAGVSRGTEGLRFIRWWKNITYSQGYFRPEEGIFVDQLPINLAPLFFKGVHILEDMGLNMAPWNLHERYLTEENGRYLVNGATTLKFFHFSSFKPDVAELPLFHYNRFTLAGRPDLQQLYADYNSRIKKAGYFTFSEHESAYSTLRKAHLKNEKRFTVRLMKKLRAWRQGPRNQAPPAAFF